MKKRITDLRAKGATSYANDLEKVYQTHLNSAQAPVPGRIILTAKGLTTERLAQDRGSLPWILAQVVPDTAQTRTPKNKPDQGMPPWSD